MQRRGLINRLLNPENHRSIYVEATEKGQALQEPVHRKIDELNDMILHNFTKPERAELQNMLRRIGRLVPTEQNWRTYQDTTTQQSDALLRCSLSKYA